MDPHNPIVQFPPRGPVILESAAVRRRRELMRRYVDIAIETLIVIVTLPGLWLISGNHAPDMRLGFQILVAGQPLYFIATWRSRRFGMFIVSIIYAAIWIRAAFNSF